MKLKALALLTLAILIISSQAGVCQTGEAKGPKIYVEIHDISPVYDVEKMRTIIDSVDRKEVDQIVLSVIPKHAGEEKNLIYKNREFVEFLKEAKEDPKIKIADHGLTHIGDEMNANSSISEEKINEINKIWERTNLSTPEIFIPPRWALSKESQSYLLKKFSEVRTDKYIFHPDKKGKHVVRPFAVNWKENNVDYWLTKKIIDYKSCEDSIYRISLHTKKAGSKGSLYFLERFFDEI